MTETVDTGRRHFLTIATVATGAVGAAFVAVPFLASWKPSARAKAMGAPVEIDIGKLEPGAMVKVEWRGKAIFVVHRTPPMLAQLEGVVGELRDPDSVESEQPEFARNESRALKPEYLVLVGVCTHSVARRSTSSRRVTRRSPPTGRGASWRRRQRADRGSRLHVRAHGIRHRDRSRRRY